MSGVFGWVPLVWAMQVALLVLVAGCSYVYLLLIAPFFRPSNVRRMLRADLPRVRSIGADVAGTNAEVQFADAAAEAERAEFDRKLRILLNLVDRYATRNASDDSEDD